MALTPGLRIGKGMITMHGKFNLSARAAAIGAEHGRLSASWAFDGDTEQSRYREVLKGIEADDPAVLDSFREPGLSGEFADDFGLTDLDRALTTKECHDQGHKASDHDDWSAACDAYEEAARNAFWAAIEATCREHLTEAAAATEA